MIGEHDIRRAEELLAVLRREHAALLSGDLAELDQAVRAKRAAAGHFEELARTAATDSSPYRVRLAELATECRRQNEINGGIVESGLRHVRAVIGVLRGGRDDHGLYTRRGENTAPDSASRPIAKA